MRRIYFFAISILLWGWGALLAQQPYVKIYVAKTGLYRVSGQELIDAGIDISQIQPHTLQLFSDGQKILPYSTAEPEPQLQEVAIQVNDGGDQQFDPQDYLLFYGQSLNRFEWDDSLGIHYLSHPYDTLACYWLRWNVSLGKRIPTKDGSPVTGGALLQNTFTDYLHLERDRFNPFHSGLVWTWNLFGRDNLFTYDIELQGVVGPDATIRARNFWFNKFSNPRLPVGGVQLTLNGATIGPMPANQPLTGVVPIHEGTNTLLVEYLPSAANDTIERFGLNWIELEYLRSTQLVGDELILRIGPLSGIIHVPYRQPGDLDPIEIYDITDPFNLVRIHTTSDSLFEDTLALQLKTYYLRRGNFAHSVTRIVPGQRGLFSVSDGADYLIITHSQMASAVLPLKTYREVHNGFTAKIVTVEDIMDEFGFGRQDPTAIRNFIRFAHTHWNPQPRFVVLAGNGYYDYRNITGDFPVNWVPLFEISGATDIDSRISDDFYTDVFFVPPGSDNFIPFPPDMEDYLLEFSSPESRVSVEADSPNSPLLWRILPRIPIGRFPANSPEELAALVHKTIAGETNFSPGLWRMSGTLVADDEHVNGDNDEFFFLQQMEALSTDFFPQQRIFKLYEREFPFVGNEKPAATRRLIDRINQGSRFLVFSGHGDENQWTHENLFNFSRDIASIRNEHRTIFFYGLNRLLFPDDGRSGIVERLIKNPSAGFSGTITATRPVFAFSSYFLVQKFWFHLYGVANGMVGSALMQAKQDLSGGINAQKFFLFGDPALSLELPPERVIITGISPDTLKARSLVEIQGQILNSTPGDSLLIEVREPGRLKQLPDGFPYELTGQALYRGYVPVQNGQFTARFVVPDDVPHDSVVARGKLFAYTWNGAQEGSGFVDSLVVGGVDTGVVDVTPPQMTLSITGGDTAAANAVFIAELFDENGINLSQLGNHFPMLFFDGNRQDTINVSDFFAYLPGSYQAGVLRYPLPYLSRGRHTITLRVHDNYNNPAEDSIAFVVTGIPSPREIVPDRIFLSQNYPNPFNPETTIRFQIEGSRSYRVRLEIFNILGQRIRTLLNRRVLAGEYEIRWDGRDASGQPVASGLYIYRLWVSGVTGGAGGNSGGIYRQAKKMLLIR